MFSEFVNRTVVMQENILVFKRGKKKDEDSPEGDSCLRAAVSQMLSLWGVSPANPGNPRDSRKW